MPTLRITGSFTAGKAADLRVQVDDCQTCGGTLDISIPYDLSPQGLIATVTTTVVDGGRGEERKITTA